MVGPFYSPHSEDSGGDDPTPRLHSLDPDPATPKDWLVKGDPQRSLANLVTLAKQEAEARLRRETEILAQGAGTTLIPPEIWKTAKILKNFLGAAKGLTAPLGLSRGANLLGYSAENWRENPFETTLRAMFAELELAGSQFEVSLEARLKQRAVSGADRKRSLAEITRFIQDELAAYVAEAKFCELAMQPKPGNPSVIESIESQDTSAKSAVGEVIARIFQDAAAAHSHRQRLKVLPQVYRAFMDAMEGPEFRLLILGGGAAGFDLAALLKILHPESQDDSQASAPENSRRLRLGVMDNLEAGVTAAEERVSPLVTSMRGLQLFKGPSFLARLWHEGEFQEFLGTYRSNEFTKRLLDESEVIVIPGQPDYLPDTFSIAEHLGALHAAKVVMGTVLTKNDPDKFVRKRLLGWQTIERDASDIDAWAERLRDITAQPDSPIKFSARRRDDIVTVEDLLMAIRGEGLPKLKGGDYFCVKVGEVNLLYGFIRDDYGLDRGIVEAVHELAGVYRDCNRKFQQAGIDNLETGSDGQPQLSAKQERVRRDEFPGLIQQIEQRSGSLAKAAEDCSFSSLEDSARADHRAYARKVLAPNLLKSPFAKYLIEKLGGEPGQVVSIAILLNDPFLRGLIAQTPGLRELAAQHPLFPTTLTGLLIEEDLLGVPVAKDHHQRLDDLFNLKHALLRSRAALGFEPNKALVFNNIACGTASEDARLIAELAGGPDAQLAAFNLLDKSPGALAIARARIEHALLTRGNPSPASKTAFLPLDIASFVPLLPEHNPDSLEIALERAHCSVAAGIDDYHPMTLRRALNIAMALRLYPGGYGVKTKVLHHGHEHQQDIMFGWPLWGGDSDEVRLSGDLLRQDLDVLRQRFGPELVLGFRGEFNPGIRESRTLCRTPELLKPGQFCVPLTAGVTNAFLIWRMDRP